MPPGLCIYNFSFTLTIAHCCLRSPYSDSLILSLFLPHLYIDTKLSVAKEREMIKYKYIYTENRGVSFFCWSPPSSTSTRYQCQPPGASIRALVISPAKVPLEVSLSLSLFHPSRSISRKPSSPLSHPPTLSYIDHNTAKSTPTIYMYIYYVYIYRLTSKLAPTCNIHLTFRYTSFFFFKGIYIFLLLFYLLLVFFFFFGAFIFGWTLSVEQFFLSVHVHFCHHFDLDIFNQIIRVYKYFFFNLNFFIDWSDILKLILLFLWDCLICSNVKKIWHFQWGWKGFFKI